MIYGYIRTSTEKQNNENVFEDLDNKNAEIRILNDIINRGHQIITERLLGYL